MTRIIIELVVTGDGDAHVESCRTIGNRTPVTPERLAAVRQLNDLGGVDMVARAMTISKAQAYRLIQQSCAQHDRTLDK